MEKCTTVRSKVIPLPLKNIDTDQILPAKFLTSVSRDGFGENLFYGLKGQDPDFVFNRPEFEGAAVLVVDDNFGCGSSREHAVWAIVGAGIRVVISKSFADIFYSNSAKNGLLLVTLPEDVVDRILEDALSGNYEVEVSLESQTVTLPDGTTHSFDLNGLDDIDYIRSRADDVDSFRKKQEENRFFTTHGAAE